MKINEDRTTVRLRADDRPIDQINCKECGRIIIVWADEELRDWDLICYRCKKGLPPEWEC